jgi:hypothetical protein
MEVPQSGNFKAVALPNPTTTSARCFGVVDLGTVDNTFPGKPVQRDRKVIIMFELPKFKAIFDDQKGEQPFMIMVEHKFSTHPDSNFSKFITSWRNTPLTEAEKLNFPIEKMIGKIALVSFQHKRKAKFRTTDVTQITNQNTSLVFTSIGPVPEEMKPITPMINKPILWLWEDITKKKEPFNKEKFAEVFKFLRAKIYTSDEFLACPTAVNIDLATAASPAQQSNQSATASSQPPQEAVGGDDGW